MKMGQIETSPNVSIKMKFIDLQEINIIMYYCIIFFETIVIGYPVFLFCPCIFL